MNILRKSTTLIIALAAATVLVAMAAGGDKPFAVFGAGESLLAAGNGATELESLTPAITRFAIRAVQPKGDVASGRFECIAIVPEAAAGTGSGEFTQNVMYVSGIVTGLEQVDKDTAVISGIGPCTGIGAGTEVNFEVTVERGGPGARLQLSVDTLPGVVFNEIVTDGLIEFTNRKMAP